MTAKAEKKPSAPRELTLTRMFDAPRERVFAAWTDAKDFAQWWGPHGFTNPVCELDARPGGTLRVVMRAPDGVIYPMTGVFHEIAAPGRLVFTGAAVAHEGHPLLEWVSTVTFAEHGGKTHLTVHERAVAVIAVGAQMLEGMAPGLTQTLERLEAHLARPREAAR